MEFNWLFSAPITHRGLHNKSCPENTMPAFRNSIENGYNIEIDVHLTKDDHIVVFHDHSLKRSSGVDKTIEELTLAELREYKLFDTDEVVPTFDEFLELVSGQVGILCEIKGNNPFDMKLTKAVIERVKTYKGNFALQSFNFQSVKYCKQNTDIPTGQLVGWKSPWSDRSMLLNFMGKLRVVKWSQPDFIAYDVRPNMLPYTSNKYLEKASKTHPILMWTVSSEERIKIAQKYANNIIFEQVPVEMVEKYRNTFRPLNN